MQMWDSMGWMALLIALYWTTNWVRGHYQALNLVVVGSSPTVGVSFFFFSFYFFCLLKLCRLGHGLPIYISQPSEIGKWALQLPHTKPAIFFWHPYIFRSGNTTCMIVYEHLQQPHFCKNKPYIAIGHYLTCLQFNYYKLTMRWKVFSISSSPSSKASPTNVTS
jgi:hypothetical protein